MRRGKPKLSALWHALDEASFGSERTLNLRESLPTVAEARQRAEVWLRARQVTKAEEVLIITGRGNNSVGGIGMIRQSILALMPSLKRRGIVESWREHSPGSIIVTLAPVSALFSVARRRRDTSAATPQLDDSSFAGLSRETVSSLRQLAINNLDSLGVEHSEAFVRKEMIRVFSTLMAALPESQRNEDSLLASLRHAISEGDDISRGKL
ncbi:MAG TPA: Smr/MutS family protein [Gemmatimonadaceae bacterium]|jgi:hypothetical protein|nr:Smr/MutS family protein [Gemmatimonadaceae bacterium]